MVETFKALSDPCRIRLIGILLRGEFTVQELTAIIGTGQSRISHHLKILAEADLVTVKRQGTWSYYRVGDGNSFFTSLRATIEPELERLPAGSADMIAIKKLLEERRQKSQEFFDRHALQWDELSRKLLPLPEYKTLFLESVPKVARLLEIGVGTGELLMRLAPLAAEIVGVDHSPAMLAEASRRVAALPAGNIDLRLGEMAHLPLPDRSVDCVIANMVLHHAADPCAVFTDIRRVLLEGGLLLVADLARHELETAREQLADQWLGFEEEELKGWLCGAGFSTVDFIRIPAEAGQESVLIIKAL